MGMVLCLDNAPCHHHKAANALTLSAHNKHSPPSEQNRAAHGMRSLVDIAREHDVPEIKLLRGDEGDMTTIKKDCFEKAPQHGGPSVQELRDGLQVWLQANRPDALQTRLAEEFDKHQDFRILWTPPCSPVFQPIELLWRDTKNFCAHQFSAKAKRSPAQTASDIMTFWFGGTCRLHGRHVTRHGPEQAVKHRDKATAEMDGWIARNAHRCSGTIGNLKYDQAKQCADDGSMTSQGAGCPDLTDDLTVDDDDEDHAM